MEFSIKDIVEDLTDLDLAILQLLHAGNDDPLKGRVAFQKEMFLIADYIKNGHGRVASTPKNMKI